MIAPAPTYCCTVCEARWAYAEIRYLARCKRCGAGLTRVTEAPPATAPPRAA